MSCRTLGHIMVVPNRQQPPTWYRPLVHYCYALLSPVVRRGARRIAINPLPYEPCATTAFANPDGSIVVVLVNSGDTGIDLAVQRDESALLLHLPGQSMLSVTV